MAKTLNDDEERKRRIILVGEYYTTVPGASVRSTAEFFTNKGLSISIATVSDYLKEYMKLFPNKANKVKTVVKSRTPKTINDPSVVDRIYREVDLVRSGYTIEQISDMSNVSYWTVRNDLEKRLNQLDQETYLEIKSIFNSNILDNLSKRGK